MLPSEDAFRIIAEGLLQNEAELCIIASDYRIVWASGQYLATRSITRERWLGRPCYELLRANDAPCADCPIKSVLDSGRPCVMEEKINLSDGSRWRGEVDVFPVYGPDNRPSFVLKMGRELGRTRAGADQDPPAPPPPADAPLSAREIDVLRLVAAGHTNPQIAARLDISRHTVKTHVTSIFNKLGTTSRTEAALMATRLHVIQ